MKDKNILTKLFLIMVLLSTVSCDYLYSLLDKEGAEEMGLVGEVVPFQENLKVKEIQTLLKIYGYNPGKPDGILGRRTRDAIEKFQIDNGLEPTRFVDEVTWAKMNVFVDYTLVVNDYLNVPLIQEILTAAGVNPGKIDGRMGERTKQAVKEFQLMHDLKPDGKIGFKTLSKMAEYLEIQAE